MAAFVKEFSGITSASSATTTVTVPVGGVPVGHALYIATANYNSATNITSASAGDNKGNGYLSIVTLQSGLTTTSISTFLCNITAALVAGDIITLTPNISTDRMAVTVFEFDEPLNEDWILTDDAGGNTVTTLSIGPTPTTRFANELVVGAFVIHDSTRSFTPGATYTAGTKVDTAAGSDDRSIVMEYKTVSSTGPQTTNGTLDAGSPYVGINQTLHFNTPGTGVFKNIDFETGVSGNSLASRIEFNQVSGLTYSSTSKIHGALSAVTGTTNASQARIRSLGARTTWRNRFYVRRVGGTWGAPGSHWFYKITDFGVVGDLYILSFLKSTGQIRLTDNLFNVVGLSTATFDDGDVCRFDVLWQVGTGITVNVYAKGNCEGTVADHTWTASTLYGTAGQLQYGMINATTGIVTSWDSIALSAGDPIGPESTFSIAVWDGAIEQPATAHVWDGATESPVRVDRTTP